MKPLAGLTVALLRRFGSILAPGKKRGSLLVLMYHRVLAAPDPMLPGEPDRIRFEAEMGLLDELCHVLPLTEAADRLYSGSLPERAACITFDDGYANNHAIAGPILSARRMPATVFVASGFIDSGRMWNDTVIEAVRCAGELLDLSHLNLGNHVLKDDEARRQAVEAILGNLKYLGSSARLAAAAAIAEKVGKPLPTNLMLSERQIRELPALGMAIGAHTVSHPILTRIDADLAEREIAGSKAVLEDISGQKVESFAYPNGRPRTDYDRTHVEMIRQAGFKTAVTTSWGAAGRNSDRFQLPRMLPWDRSAFGFAARLLRTYRHQGVNCV
jgi:peptidoglycan/xylan/chitin deacetylase (PgdA/CDA1 family)